MQKCDISLVELLTSTLTTTKAVYGIKLQMDRMQIKDLQTVPRSGNNKCSKPKSSRPVNISELVKRAVISSGVEKAHWPVFAFF